jgi:dTDP-4-amino-4,6-dideoxygalactose transaminase
MKIEVYSPTIRRKEMDAVLTAMVEDKIGPGERARLLIQIAKEHLNFDYALALRSPAVALHLALKALNTQPGQGVVVSALSPAYYFQVLEDLRLTPLFADVSGDFPCMNRDTVEKALAEKPEGLEARCVVLHHTLGFLPDTAAIAELGLPVIEDVSQSVGTQGDIQGVFSILGLEERDMLTSGGGAVLFSMNRRDGTSLRNFSSIPDEYCLPDINAALAVVQFKESVRNLERRREIAEVYTQSSLAARHKRFAPLCAGRYNNYAFPLVLQTGLKDVVAYARKKDIVLESAFEKTLAARGMVTQERCPVSHSLSLRTILFPLYPRLRSREAELVSKIILTLP